MIKIYECGLCKREKFSGTRKDLRKHLREIHRIVHQITNRSDITDGGRVIKSPNCNKTKQGWWIDKEFK